MKKILAIIVLFCSFSVYSQKIQVIDPVQFKKEINQKNVQLVDVRTPDEYKAGHIKNAKNINYSDQNFKKNIEKLDKNKPVYIYCQAGGRSAKASKIMSDAGFTKIIDLQGGYSSWKE